MLETGLDAAETIEARNSLEKMMAHQMAAMHLSTMKLAAQLNRCIERMDREHHPDLRERANVQGTRLAGAIARMSGSYQSGMTTMQRLRSGGTQRVIVQHVTVTEGGQAVVAGQLETAALHPGGGHGAGGGVLRNERRTSYAHSLRAVGASERLASVWREAPGWSAMPRCCDVKRALPHAWRAKHGAAHARGTGAVAQVQLEARVLLGRGEARAARGASAVSPASPIDRGRERGRRSRPHQLNVRRGAAASRVICTCECPKTAEVE